MNKTYLPKKGEIQRSWYLVDAKNKILGRLASKVALILRGKHKKIFTKHLDLGDNVVVINASRVKVTGRKLQEKLYRFYSGYPGGLKEIPLGTMLKKKPELVIRSAVRRMLPGGPLGRDIVKKLKVYPDDKHPHTAQKLTTISL